MKSPAQKIVSIAIALLTACPAFADDTTNTTTSQTPANPAPVLHLFGGVTHSESVPHAESTLRTHREKIQKLRAMIPEPPEIANAQPHPQPVPAKSAPPVKENAEITQQTHPAPTMTTERPVTAPYEPAFGVARPGAETAAPVLQANVAKQHYRVEWFMLPSWMAGAWVKDGDMTTSVTDLRTGRSSSVNEWTENRLESHWGHQMDSRGNVWHANLLPAEKDGYSAGKLVRFLTVALACEKSDPSVLLTRTHYIVSESSQWNGQPVDTFQQESLNHYALDGAGQLINSSSNRVFTYQGQPTRDGTLLSTHRKISNFSPVESLGGINLRESLAEYLQSIGR